MTNGFLNIVDYIPLGSENAVSRRELCLRTGLDDRTMRDDIEKARGHCAICNDQDGRGYYIPRLKEGLDITQTIAWVKRTKEQAKKMDASTLATIDLLEKAGVDVSCLR